MRTDTIYDILQSCTQSQYYQDTFKRAVIGMIVLTDYNNKFYRIDDVDFTTKPCGTFKTKTGQTSFVDYYRTKYNIRILDPNQPMLISRAKARDIRAGQAEIIALVPELCRATGISDTMRSNFQLMRAMANYTKVNADVRMKKLYTLYQRLAQTPESMTVFKEWDLKLDSNLIEIVGRELKNENIVFGNGVKVPTDENADWTREFRNNKLFTTVPLARWYVVVPDRNQRETQDFLGCLIDAARGMGFKIEQPNKVTIRDDRSQTYVTAIEKCSNDDPQLIFCVVPNDRADRYSAIKKKCCVDRAIPTQVMQARTVTPKRGANVRSLMSVATKVAIQLNCKLGCAPWLVEIPLSGLMTIGFDVCHDSSNKAKSYGALVATMDLRTSSNYFSAVSAHKNGEELSNEMSLNVSKALKHYQLLHGKLPSRIIFYRDGVGEGQLQFVIEHEIEHLKTKLNQYYASQEQGYNFAFIVVNKRVNARFFKGNYNPKPGTVIDDVVTSPESYDFYLVSQLSRQGTVSPTYYNIVTENIGLNADRLQILTYKQCHLYYNWSGTTRVPAVCQYAHKLAFLVGQFIHQSPSNLLDKSLYFL
jgi:aubergine-like protein